MPSIIEICNQALGNLGTKSAIQALNEASTEAKECLRWYDPSRKSTLERFDWGFARRRAALALHTVDAPDTWGYRYQWPATCIAARYIPDPGDDDVKVPFRQENASDGSRSLLTNLGSATLIYTFDATDPNLFTPTFVDALSFLMAFRMAPKLTASKGKQKEMADAYEAFFKISTGSNANQQTSNPVPDADWIKGR